MQKFIVRRIVEALLSLLAVSIIVFLLARATGDPAVILSPPEANPQEVEQVRQSFGLDKPLYIQYERFITKALTGDFGVSHRWHVPVLPLIGERLVATLELTSAAFLLALPLGILAGIIAAVKKGSRYDTGVRLVALVGQSAPPFWVGLILILIFASTLKLLPSAGKDSLLSFVLPVVTLGLYQVAALARLTRSSMLDVLHSEYVKMARIKGLSERVVIGKHALANVLIPVVTLASLQYAHLVQGAVLVETVFAWPGLGRLAVDAIQARDFPVIQVVVLVAAGLVILINLFTDLSYAYLDPRIRYR